ncbi:TRAP transporter substrate-binding protein [Nocardioides guangzhouensis]|nr:hypothetical protein [Nocardioides guangzhouensis]
MRVRLSRLLAGATTVSALTLAPGCAPPVDGPGLVLTLATPDKPSDSNGPHVQHFVDEVARLSGGSIRIEPVWDVASDGAHGWDQTTARGVADGTWDLGLVPGRAWDELGVTSLRALDTPFLVTSTDVLEQVLDSDLREELLAGLPEAGVVGLDLYPEGLRHPVGFEAPLLGPEDYRGQVIRAPRSATTWKLLEALGARVVDDNPSPAKQRGMETGYDIGTTGIATGNVVLFPKTETLVVDAEVRERLRGDQWELLRDAAANTRDWLFEELPTEAEAAADFCDRGGRIVTASPTQLEQLELAGTGVTARLREDDQTRRLIDAIEGYARSHPDPEVVPRCPTAATETSGPRDEAIHRLDGVYTTRVTRHAMRAAGVTEEERILENVGTYTWTLDGGVWTYDQRADHFLSNPRGTGTYSFDDGRFTLYWGDGGNTAATLEIAPDGSIAFRDIVDSNPEVQAESEGFFSAPWHRVGDLEE